MHRPVHAWFNNCTSNSQVIAQGESEYIFDWYKYNYSLIALKYMWLPTNHIALPMTLYPYSKDRHEFQWGLIYQCDLILENQPSFHIWYFEKYQF